MIEKIWNIVGIYYYLQKNYFVLLHYLLDEYESLALDFDNE